MRRRRKSKPSVMRISFMDSLFTTKSAADAKKRHLEGLGYRPRVRRVSGGWKVYQRVGR